MKYFKKIVALWRQLKCEKDIHNVLDSDNLSFPKDKNKYECKHCRKHFKIVF